MTDATRAITELLKRRNYLDEQAEVRGANHWRAREIESLNWALDQFEDSHPTDMDEAEAATIDLARRRAERAEREASRT